MNAPLPTIEAGTVMPSIGDRVLLHLNGATSTQAQLTINGGLPLAATVAYVWGPAMVNLNVIDHNGASHALTSVAFNQPGDDAPACGMYCELEVILGGLIEGGPGDADIGRPQTYGEKAVGLAFNPGGLDEVTEAKAEAAMLIDRANDLRQASASPEVKRMASLAITAAQEAQMWLVKALTWKD